MAELHELRRPPGSHRNRKRKARGPGSGNGKTAGRGQDGQKSRSGGSIPAWFEGGQMPLQRRIPKRGFFNRNRVEYQIVNLRDLDRVEESEITLEVLRANGLVRSQKPVKILGLGDIDRKVNVTVHALSGSARAKIEAAGGSVTLVDQGEA